jgi:signal transduction histidine kinase
MFKPSYRALMRSVSAGPHVGSPASYVTAAVFVALCAVARWMLGPILGGQGVYLAFVIPVALSAYLGGTGPGAFSIILSSIAADPLIGADRAAAHLVLFVCEAIALMELVRRLRRNEADSRRALEEAEAARRDAETADAAKEQFVARVSHECRTPLNAVAGWVWQIEHRPDDPVFVRRAAGSMRRAVETQSRLVSDLLDYSRGRSGKLSIRPEWIELDAVLRRSVDSVASDAALKQQTLEIRGQSRGARIWGDPMRLEQVFVNLLHNAVKFTPRSGHVAVTVVRNTNSVEIAVSDSGAGIERDRIAAVFDAFVQMNEQRDVQHGGLGLGLSIVRQIVELHGGSVRATSDGPGRGSTFRVCLPSAASEDSTAPRGHARVSSAFTSSG